MRPERNWGGNHAYRFARFHEPESLDELISLVGEATRLRVVASRHCFNDIGDTDAVAGDLVSLRRLPTHHEVDSERRVVRVSAAASYGELAAGLNAEGWALSNLASLPHISVGGAVATGTHGSGDRCGNLAASVVGLEVIRADGSVVSVNQGEPTFPGEVIALGATGVWSHVLLSVEPTYDVVQTVMTGLPWSAALKHLDEVTGAAWSTSLFTSFQGDEVEQVWLKARMTEQSHGGTWFGAQAAAEPLHMLRNGNPAACTEQMGVPGPWHTRLPHFRLEFTPSSGRELQSEYLLPRGNTVEALAAMRELGDLMAPVLQVAEIRTVAEDRLWLSGSYETDVIAIHCTWHPDEPAVRAVLQHVESALLPLGARPHWGKLFLADAGVLAAAYPRLTDFRELAHRVDPRGKFHNPYLHRVLGI
jgi:xylitol oxidase